MSSLAGGMAREGLLTVNMPRRVGKDTDNSVCCISLMIQNLQDIFLH